MLLSKAHIEIQRRFGKEAKFAVSLGRTKAKMLSASGGEVSLIP